jgi:hypothetical protein
MFDFLIDIIPREEAAAWDTGVAEGSKGRGKGKGKGKGKARGRPKKKRTIEEVEEEPERGGSPGGADGEGEGEDDDEDDTGHREKRSRIDVEGDDAQHPSVLNGNGAARLELPPVAPPGDLQVGNAEVAELDKAQRQMYLMQQYQRQNGGSPQSEALNGQVGSLLFAFPLVPICFFYADPYGIFSLSSLQQQFGQPASGLAWTASPYGYNMVRSVTRSFVSASPSHASGAQRCLRNITNRAKATSEIAKTSCVNQILDSPAPLLALVQVRRGASRRARRQQVIESVFPAHFARSPRVYLSSRSVSRSLPSTCSLGWSMVHPPLPPCPCPDVIEVHLRQLFVVCFTLRAALRGRGRVQREWAVSAARP